MGETLTDGDSGIASGSESSSVPVADERSAAADEQSAESEKITFSFGRNWQDYVERHLTPEREALARVHLMKALGVNDLNGRSFIDVGCGSGLFSSAAHHLGAASVISFDIDPFSAACCRQMRQRAGQPRNWKILEGSVLDEKFLAGIAPADVVYAFGSLHHSGTMWQAIRNAAGLVKPGGLYFLAIYNKVTGRGSSEYWTRVKQRYNRVGSLGKNLMLGAYTLRYAVIPEIIRFRNPFRYMREYGQHRGMSYWVDARDWLGGYPYEYASVEEIFEFCSLELGLQLAGLKTTLTTGTNHYLFRRGATTTT